MTYDVCTVKPIPGPPPPNLPHNPPWVYSHPMNNSGAK